MTSKLTYTAPHLSEWGSVANLTQGMGGTNFTDDFICVNAEGKPGEQQFKGSTGKCAQTTLPL